MPYPDNEPFVETIDPDNPSGAPVRAIIPRSLVAKYGSFGFLVGTYKEQEQGEEPFYLP